MQIRDIIVGLEQLAPKRMAESWDNVGLLVGAEDWPVSKIMVALDATEDVIDQCIHQQVDLLITHHPMLFSKVNRITTADATGRKIMKLIKHQIACYAMHTNFDVTVMGMEGAKKLGLTNPRVLQQTGQESFYKLVVYVPTDSVDKVRAALCKEDAGHIGNYSGCSFGAEGIGSYKPEEGTNPYIGKINEMTHTNEVRLETIVRPEKLEQTIQSMLKAHPYEEVAYDVYKLENKGKITGVGYYGYLQRDMLLEELAAFTKQAFSIPNVKVCGNLGRRVASVAISPGSGKSMVKDALRAKCDVLITGDIDHHAALDALEAGLMIIDAGHYGTEYQFVSYMRGYINEYLYRSDANYVGVASEIEVIAAREEGPFKVM
ncbi:MAG: Nif3-like dinuclear metal center hexameric protein [bacterium]|nr:Nif3-like dinuclear metal center hexameric protein [bacterium]